VKVLNVFGGQIIMQMQSKRGQMGMVGGLIMLAITIIVGAILMQGAAQNTDSVVNLATLKNYSLGTIANSTTVYITTYKSISNPVVTNSTNGAVIAATNFTITNNVAYNGGEAIKFTATAKDGEGFTGAVWQINGTVQPLAYADSAGRSLTNLIIIMTALALLAVVVGYVVKSSQLD